LLGPRHPQSTRRLLVDDSDSGQDGDDDGGAAAVTPSSGEGGTGSGDEAEPDYGATEDELGDTHSSEESPAERVAAAEARREARRAAAAAAEGGGAQPEGRALLFPDKPTSNLVRHAQCLCVCVLGVNLV
jgi:hypothetical protein